MPHEFKLTRRIEFAETDMAGIVHFSNFFRLMEAAEHAFFRSMGYSIHSEVEGHIIGWPRVGASCDYLRPLRFEDEVEIHLQVAEVRSRSLRFRFIFRRLPDGLEVAHGKMSTVCATVAAGQLVAVAIPEDLRVRLTPAPEPPLRVGSGSSF